MASVGQTLAQSSSTGRLSARHLPFLDGLRGLAILLVLFDHFTDLEPRSAAQWLVKNLSSFGSHGVDLFFVLSGFLITGILLDSRKDPHFFRNFYARRTLRIFPLYYAILAFSFSALPRLIARFPEYSGKLAGLSIVSSAWPWYVVYCSNYVIAWNHAWLNRFLDVTWSLAIEEQYYLVWAVCVYLFPTRRIIQAAWVGIFVLPILRLGLLWLGAGPLQVYVLTPTRLDGVLWGSLLALAARDGGQLPVLLDRVIKPAGSICAVPVLAIVLLGRWDIMGRNELGFGYSAVSLMFAALLWTGYRQDVLARQFFEQRWLRFFGVYSYSIYLFHRPILSGLRNVIFGDQRFRLLFCSSIEGQLLLYWVAILAVIPFSVVSWYFLEQPFLRLKRLFAPHEWRLPSSPAASKR
jgi:peptidoglycan/LPS O-acetylase OafA/YrhL